MRASGSTSTGPKRAVAAVGSTFGSVKKVEKIFVENRVFYKDYFDFFLSSDPGVGFRDRIQAASIYR